MTLLQTLTLRGRKHLGLVTFVGIQLILFSCSNVDRLKELPIDFRQAKDQISQAVHSFSKIKRNLSFFVRILRCGSQDLQQLTGVTIEHCPP